MFVIESILDSRKEKNEVQYLIKWLGFPIGEATWEPENNIPKFIKIYYENESKYGAKLPSPKIKHTKTIGGVEYHFLQWDGETSGNWFGEDFFSILSEDGELVKNIEMDSSCNTRKSRDKRERRHTVGVFVGAYPCGNIVVWDELFGSESISQVYGILMEFLGNLSNKEKIEQCLYDDACHLKKSSEDPKRSSQNDVTSYFTKIPKNVDKFHFKNHIYKWCHANCNP